MTPIQFVGKLASLVIVYFAWLVFKGNVYNMGVPIGGGLSWWRFNNELLCGVQSLQALIEEALDDCFKFFDVLVDVRCNESRPPLDVKRANGYYLCHLWWVV